MLQTIRKSNLILGTLMLTLAGVLTRIIGFFYRIFLSRQIGEEGMGIYQLLSPLMALSFSFTCAGIQTSLSKHVAACEAENRHQKSILTLFCAFFISVLLSLFAGLLLCRFRIYISVAFLSEERCQNLITIYALSLPFCAIHSCINGYHFGLKKTTVPSVTQLIEQLVRVCSVIVLFFLFPDTDFEKKIAFAVLGLTLGEIASSMTSLFILRPVLKGSANKSVDFGGYNRAFCSLLSLAAPLSLNRIILNTLQSIEAAYLPRKLTEYGYAPSEALSVYGVFMGMALPMILFPQAVTSSVSVLLLPYVSEAEAKKDRKKISHSIFLTTTFCVLLGFACLVFFYLTGPLIGTLIFHSEDAGLFIRTLSFMCPFLYLGTLLTSILNGLGKATLSFLIHISSISIRLLGIFIMVPVFGIKAYLYFLMLGQILYCVLNFVALKKYLYYNDSRCFRNLNGYKRKSHKYTNQRKEQ